MEFIEHQQELTELVEKILSEAKKQGSDQAEVSVSMEQGLGVSVRKGELENLSLIKIEASASRCILANARVRQHDR